MKQYLSFLKLRFNVNLQYRFAAIAGLATQFFWGAMFIMIYKAYYANGVEVEMSWQSLVTYIWLGQALFAFVGFSFSDDDISAATRINIPPTTNLTDILSYPIIIETTPVIIAEKGLSITTFAGLICFKASVRKSQHIPTENNPKNKRIIIIEGFKTNLIFSSGTPSRFMLLSPTVIQSEVKK